MKDRLLVQAEALLLLVILVLKLGSNLLLFIIDLGLEHLLSPLLLQLLLFLNLHLSLNERLQATLVHLVLQVRYKLQVLLRVNLLLW